MDVLWSLEVRIVMHSNGIHGCFKYFLDIYFPTVMVPTPMYDDTH